MTRFVSSLVLSSLLVLPAGCIFHVGGSGDWDDIQVQATDAAAVRNRNLERLDGLALGMTIEEAKEAMGSSAAWLGESIGWVNNPYRSESFQDKNGATLLVLYYYTHLRKRDDIIAEDELTPVGFRDGVLVGWGQGFLDRQVEEF